MIRKVHLETNHPMYSNAHMELNLSPYAIQTLVTYGQVSRNAFAMTLRNTNRRKKKNYIRISSREKRMVTIPPPFSRTLPMRAAAVSHQMSRVGV